MMVKICGITRRQDAETAVEAGASALGFVFYPKSPRYIAPAQAAEIGDGLNVWKVGVFVDESPASVEAVMRSAHLDIAQIYGAALPSVERLWRAIRVLDSSARVGQAPWPARDPQVPPVEAILLDGPSNGTAFDWTTARASAEKIIVAGGLDSSNVAEAIRIARPWGVDASSKLESSPGIKDPDRVKRFIEAAMEAA
jgi:phosphoribosylanthranilate isomerase